MEWKNSKDNWGLVAKFLHWFVFAFLVGQITLGFVMEDFEGPTKGELYGLHKALGMTALVVIVFRLLWRISGPIPKDPPMPHWQKESARITIWILYALMLLIPISGYFMSAFSGKSIDMFGFFTIEPITTNPEFAKPANKFHKFLIWPLMGFAILHISAALYHHFVMKDNVLKRMLFGKS